MATSLLGLLLGFGVIVYMLFCIKRGYLLTGCEFSKLQTLLTFALV